MFTNTFAFDPKTPTTPPPSRYLRASTVSPDSCVAEDIIPPSPKRRSTPPPFIPNFSTAIGFPTHFNFNTMGTQYTGGFNSDASTDEGYDEQKFETPSYMMSWSEEQRAEFAFQLLMTLPTSRLSSVHARITPLLHRDFLSLLPYELAIHILAFTDALTLGRVSRVSKQWHKISEDQQLWRRFFLREGWTVNRRMIDMYLGSCQNPNTITDEAVDGMEGVELTGGGESGSESGSGSGSGSENSKGKGRGIEMPKIDEDAEIAEPQDTIMLMSPTATSSTALSMSMPQISSASSSTSTLSASVSIVSAPAALPVPTHVVAPAPAPASIPVSVSTPTPILAPMMTSRLRSLRRPSELLLRLRNRHAAHLAANAATASVASQTTLPSTSATIPARQLSAVAPVAQRPIPSRLPIPIAPSPPTFPHPHHQDDHGRPLISWKHLYRNRYTIEKHWREGVYRAREIPSAENIQDGHQEGIYCVQFDESKIVSGSRDNTIKIWDMKTGQCLRTLSRHTASVLCLQYDDRYIVSGSSDNTMIQWDLATGDVVRVLGGHHESVLNLKLDPDHIVSCSKDRTVKIWSLSTGELLRTLQGHRAAVNAVQFQDGLVVSASGDRTIKLWDMATGVCLRTFDSHSRGIACVQFDGRLVVSGSSDRTIKVWDVTTGACMSTLSGHGDLVRTLQFDGGRNRIVSGSYDETLKVWDWKSGRVAVDLKDGHTSRVFKLQFNDTKIVSCSQDQKIIVWDFAVGVDTTFLI